MLKKYQEQLEEIRKKLHWTYWPPVVGVARLAEEVGEVSRIILHLENIKPKKKTEAQQEIGEELADVIMVLLWMANTLDVDLDKEVEKVLKKIEKRDEGRYKGTKYSK